MGGSTPLEAPEGIQGNKVRVVVRIRPFLSHEQQGGCTPPSCLAEAHGRQMPSSSVTLVDRRGGGRVLSQHGVDSCWDSRASGGVIFRREVAPLLPGIAEGVNTTIFTHGASGSGKTHTMQGTAADPGLTPLAVAELLQLRQALRGLCQLGMSFVEVYLDRCYDLLEPKGELQVLEDAGGDIQMPRLAQVPLTGLPQFEALFAAGCARRRTGGTGMNAVSSRSHSLVVVTMSRRQGTRRLTGKLNLIDLAGFEDNRRTGNEGERMTESTRINSSLFALHKVILALTAGQAHVPYRDSKLTRLLRDSLGGTSRALLLLCLAPGAAHLAEAQASLALAGQSRQVVNQPAVHTSEEQPPPPASPLPPLHRAAALRAWQEANGRLPRPLVSPHPAAVTPHTSRLAPPRVPPDAAARLARVERQLLFRCPASPPLVDPPQEAAPPEGGTSGQPGSGSPATQGRGSPDGGQSDKENVRPGSPRAALPASACPGWGAGQRLNEGPPPASRPLSPTTPLHKLRQLQESTRSLLERECLAVLNAGDRAQLLCLRGIGEKRADAVLQLRQGSPGAAVFHSKEDLAKIGLKGKQILKIFEDGVLKVQSDLSLPRGKTSMA